MPWPSFSAGTTVYPSVPALSHRNAASEPNFFEVTVTLSATMKAL